MTDPKYRSQVVDGPSRHAFQRVELRWYDDGTLRVICKTGRGRIEVDRMGTGNYRVARFSLKRKS